MKVSARGLKRLDRILGRWLPGLVHAFHPILSARPSILRSREVDSRPLIVRPGGLGDLVCLHMAIEATGLDPGLFRFLVERRSAPWAALHGLDHVTYDGAGFAELLRERGSSPVVLCTEQRFGLALAVAEACRAPKGRLYAFETCRGSQFAGARIVAYDPRASHEVEAFCRMIRDAFPDQVVVASRGWNQRARQEPTDGSLIACLSGGGQPSREFHAGEWVQFMDAWAGPLPVRLTAAPSDWDKARAIVQRRAAPTSFCAAGFPEMVEDLKKARAILTVDGGMAHVASFYGIPATVLFTSGQVEKWRPLSEGSRVVAVEGLPCRPCTLFGQVPPCPHGFACKRIPIETLPQLSA